MYSLICTFKIIFDYIDKLFNCIGELSLKDFKASMQPYQSVKLCGGKRKGQEVEGKDEGKEKSGGRKKGRGFVSVRRRDVIEKEGYAQGQARVKQRF